MTVPVLARSTEGGGGYEEDKERSADEDVGEDSSRDSDGELSKSGDGVEGVLLNKVSTMSTRLDKSQVPVPRSRRRPWHRRVRVSGYYTLVIHLVVWWRQWSQWI